MCIKKYNLVILLFIIFLVFINCTSTQSSTATKKDSISVLDVPYNIKLEAFEFSVFRYFRRYNPTLQNDGTFLVQYGKYPVIVSFDNERIYIESSVPEKHALWLSNIYKRMKQIINKK